MLATGSLLAGYFYVQIMSLGVHNMLMLISSKTIDFMEARRLKLSTMFREEVRRTEGAADKGLVGMPEC